MKVTAWQKVYFLCRTPFHFPLPRYSSTVSELAGRIGVWATRLYTWIKWPSVYAATVYGSKSWGRVGRQAHGQTVVITSKQASGAKQAGRGRGRGIRYQYRSDINIRIHTDLLCCYWSLIDHLHTTQSHCASCHKSEAFQELTRYTWQTTNKASRWHKTASVPKVAMVNIKPQLHLKNEYTDQN